MRTSTSLILVLAALVALPAASAFAIDFDTPAQVTGTLDGQDAAWALFAFDQVPDAAFQVHIAVPSSHWNHTMVRFSPILLAGQPVQTTKEIGNGTRTAYPSGVDFSLQFQGRPHATLFVQADSIRISGQAEAVLAPMANGEAVDDYLGTRAFIQDYRPGAHVTSSDGAVVQMGTDRSGLAFDLAARGLKTIEWHNATIACTSCPDGAGTTTVSTGSLIVGATATERYFGEIRTSDGAMDASGFASRLAIGGESLSMGANGTFRLPLANIGSDCAAECPSSNETTIQGAGNITLAHLRPSGGSRLTATMLGTATDVRFDENPAPNFLSSLQNGVQTGAILIGAAGSAWLIVKFLVPLFSRQTSPNQVLLHPARNRLMSVIHSSPGLSYRAVIRESGLRATTARHHLGALGSAGLITVYRHGRNHHYFEKDGTQDVTWKRQAAYANPKLGQLHTWLEHHPGARERDIVEFGTSTWNCSRTAVQKTLGRLIEWGLVVRMEGPVGGTYAAVSLNPGQDQHAE